jgi:hypothetical protein
MATMDCGVPTGRRAWDLVNPRSIIPRDMVIRGAMQVLVFVQRKADICKAAATFSSVDRTDPHKASVEALFQEADRRRQSGGDLRL